MKILMTGTRGSLEYTHYSRIYPQGWLMVHYFQSSVERQQRLLAYFDLLNKGESQETAVNQGLGVSFLELDREIREYAKTRRLPYSVITLENGWELPTPKTRRLTSSDILAEAGRFITSHPRVLVRGETEKEASAKYRQRSVKAAKSMFERSLEIDPNNEVALPGLARLVGHENPESGQSLLAKALEAPSISPDAYVMEGEQELALMRSAKEAAARLQHRKNAVRAFNKAIKLDAENVQAMVAAASLYEHEEKWETAIALLEGAVAVAPSNSSLRKELILAHLGAGQPEAAELEAVIIRRDAHHTQESLQEFEDWYKSAGGQSQGSPDSSSAE